MFSKEVIQRKIDAIEKAKSIKLRENSVEECITLYDHFRSMEISESKHIVYCRSGETYKQFKFTDKEQAWIQNEMLMCACSFPYWFFRYFFVKSTIKKDGNVVNEIIRRPDVWIAQLIYLEILAGLDLLGLPILLLALKARQLGISTVTEAIIQWIAIFTKGSHCVVASSETEKSEEMANMVWLGLDMMPLWMKPVLTREDRKIGPEFGLIHSDIILQHGSQMKGIATGSTPIAAHLSEVAYYPNPIETIERSLIRAMHENPRTFLVLESTARKKEDWFHKTWLKNRRGEQEGYNRFTCLFLPWYVGRDIYPTPDFLLSHPIPRAWQPLKETLKQALDAKLYVSTTPLLKKHMRENWEMDREQMWFWEFNYHEALEGGDETLKAFMSELAADERSCFQSKRWSVFSQSVLDKLESEQSKEYVDYAIIGDGVDERFALKDFQSHALKRIDVEWATSQGQNFYWKLIPLKETPRDDNLDFYLRIWEKPKSGYRYTIGIDISSGKGQNRTVFFVNRVGKEGEPDKEVALLCSAWIASPETPAFANVLGIWYGQYMGSVSPYVAEALIVPEVQLAVGDFISHQLDKLGYSNLYYHRRYDLRRHPGQKDNRRGWVTSNWSRQMMMEAFEHAIKNGWIEINSDELISELESLESDLTESDKAFYDHSSEGTDDVYMAGGIAYFTSHPEQTIMERMKGSPTPKRKKDVSPDMLEKETGISQLARKFMLQDINNKDMSEAEEGENHVY